MTAVALVERLFHDLLEVDDIEPGSDFFDAGGNSLLATRLVAALRRDGWPVLLDDVLFGRTVQAIAEAAERAWQENQVSAAGGSRSASEAAREILDHVEAEVLHECRTALAPARVALTRPLAETVEPARLAAVRSGLSALLGIELPTDVVSGSPARIAAYARPLAPPPAMPVRLVDGADDGAPVTLLFGPTPATVSDLRRAVAGRRPAAAAYGFLPVVGDDPALPGASFEPMLDATLEAIGALAAPRRFRIVGYCSSAWFANAVADRLVAQGAQITDLVAINPPTLEQLHLRDFRYLVGTNFGLDYEQVPPEVAGPLHVVHHRWLAGEVETAAAALEAVAAVEPAMPVLLAGTGDPDAYGATERAVFLRQLAASLTYQFSVGLEARSTDIMTTVVISNDATYLDEATTPDISAAVTIHRSPHPQRLLLRRPEVARLVLGPHEAVGDV
ncbi:acyl carrier protein [Actinoplanes sp. NPDC026619]|uniref:acyl carrier protein n=1 Tax=Actinoplanes sp. NPDC026619 TaxID=3155798 RepID=UPI0033FCE1A9